MKNVKKFFKKGKIMLPSITYESLIRLADSLDIEDPFLFFLERTHNHINLVQKYCNNIYQAFGENFRDLLDRGAVHDQSKFQQSEVYPYVLITWDKKCKIEKRELRIPQRFRKEMTEATEHHVKTNRHHPEFHSDQTDTINEADRDKPKKLIDATEMEILDIAEMCADWMAMSEELGGSPVEWAENNINIRWKFAPQQESAIYNIIDTVY